MLKIVLLTLLVLFSILTGLFPASENSPHTKILNFFGYQGEINYIVHILVGTFSFLCASFLAQQKDINYMWK